MGIFREMFESFVRMVTDVPSKGELYIKTWSVGNPFERTYALVKDVQNKYVKYQVIWVTAGEKAFYSGDFDSEPISEFVEFCKPADEEEQRFFDKWAGEK